MKLDLLRIDCTGALFVGVAVFALHFWLAKLYALPAELFLAFGVVNLLYGSFSASLSFFPHRRTLPRITTLALANMAWAPVCFFTAFHFFGTASPFGLVHLVGEGLYVGTLGAFEWRARHQLASAG